MVPSPTLSPLGYDLAPLPEDQLERWTRALTPEQFEVTQRSGTEAPFCGGLLDQKNSGVYGCIVCGLPLFSDAGKFDSGTGWPSFHSAVDDAHVRRIRDASHGMERTEIRCARCDAHLGHVFPDGPPPTGERHCLNSASLRFVPSRGGSDPTATPTGFRRAYFAGGSFWSGEHSFTHAAGVLDVVHGYQGGMSEEPTHDAVCAGGTGHAEAMEVIYDPSRITFRALLEYFFEHHDASRKSGKGSDVGAQYRSAVFYLNEDERLESLSKIAELEDGGAYGGRAIVTQVQPAQSFWRAEDEFQPR